MYYNPIAPHLFPTKRHLLLGALVLIVVSLGVIVENKKEDEKKKVITERNMNEIELQDKQGEKNIDNAEGKDILSGITYNKDGEIDLSSIAMPDGTQDLATEDWLTYRNEEYGFSFMYPRGWEVREFDHLLAITTNDNGKEDKLGLIRFVYKDNLKNLWDYDGEKTLEEYIQRRTGEYEQEIFRFRDVEEITIDDLRATKLIQYNGYLGTDQSYIYWERNGGIFYIVFELDLQIPFVYKIFVKLINSINFIN